MAKSDYTYAPVANESHMKDVRVRSAESRFGVKMLLIYGSHSVAIMCLLVGLLYLHVTLNSVKVELERIAEMTANNRDFVQNVTFLSAMLNSEPSLTYTVGKYVDVDRNDRNRRTLAWGHKVTEEQKKARGNPEENETAEKKPKKKPKKKAKPTASDRPSTSEPKTLKTEPAWIALPTYSKVLVSDRQDNELISFFYLFRIFYRRQQLNNSAFEPMTIAAKKEES